MAGKERGRWPTLAPSLSAPLAARPSVCLSVGTLGSDAATRVHVMQRLPTTTSDARSSSSPSRRHGRVSVESSLNDGVSDAISLAINAAKPRFRSRLVLYTIAN